MKNKKLFIGLSTLAVISLIVTGCGKKAELKDGAEIAVSVKGAKFTATEYYEEIKEKNITELIDMIDHALLDELYKADDKENEAVKSQIDQIKSYYGSDEETYNSILLQYFGVENEEAFEEMLRLEYKRNKAVTDYVSDNLTDKEIEKYYKDEIYGEVKASHILIIPSVSDDADEDEIAEAEAQALKTAKTVIQKLKDGEDFAKLAKKYSQEEATATKGGDLGYFELDEMVDEFSDAVKELKVNEYTKEPVKSQYGYHVVLKTGEKEKPELKDVKDDIKEKMTQQKLSADVTLYYQTLIDIRKANNIKWNDTVIEKKYNELMDQLIEAAKQQAQQQ